MKKIISCIFLTIFSLILFSNLALAEEGTCDPAQDPKSQACQDLLTKLNEAATKGVKLANPLGASNDNVSVIFGNIILTFLGISGAVALIIFLYGGLTWMTSTGNEEKVRAGKDTLIWAVLGLAVIFSSYAILRTVFQSIDFLGK